MRQNLLGRVWRALATLVMLGVLFACHGPLAPWAGPATDGSISGQALRAGETDHSGILVTAEATDGVRSLTVQRALSLQPRGARTIAARATTDSSGRFTLGGLAAGTYVVTASADGGAATAVSAPISIGSGQASKGILLNVALSGQVAGLASMDDAPAGGNLGIVVFLAGTSWSAITAQDGSYTISCVPPGKGYVLVASKPGYESFISTVDVAIHETSNVPPIVLRKTAAQPSTGSVHGLALLSDGPPHADILVYIRGGSCISVTDDSGAFRLDGVAPGSYSLGAGKQGYSVASTQVSVAAGVDTDAGSLALEALLSQVSVPQFSPGGGSFTTDQSVTISDATPGATIHVELASGGALPADPDGASAQYVSPIAVTGDGSVLTIKAIALKPGMAPSPVVTATYTIEYPEEPPPVDIGIPGNLRASGITASAITLSWDSLSLATSYELFRDSSESGSFSTRVYAGTAATFADSGLLDGSTYYYEVRGVAAAGPGERSAPLSVTTVMTTVFVSPGGQDTHPGSRTYPVRTIARALQLAAAMPDGASICLSNGYYAGPVDLINGVSLHGGLSDITWTPDPGATTVIHADATSSDVFCLRAISVTTPIELTDITVEAASAASPGRSSYGMYFKDSSGITLRRVVIVAGDGADGIYGTVGANGMAGATGGTGGAGEPDGSWPGYGGPGGASPAGPAAYGGRGGNGGESGENDGQDGMASPGGAPGGFGGAWGDPGLDGSSGSWGSTGATGSPGSPGIGGSLVAGLWLGANGGAGLTGGYGIGGGGGGGGGAQSGFFVDDGSGNGGGGGGGGGSGGTGGTGGTGGGGSFGIFLVSSFGITLDSCQVSSGRGGDGGAGARGGYGGSGGQGGLPGTEGDGEIGKGGYGGRGGTGGAGGAGGGGAGGPSFAVYLDSLSTFVRISTILQPGLGGYGGPSPGVSGANGSHGEVNR